MREATEGSGRETKTVWELEEGGRLRKHFTPPPANSVGQRRNKKAGVKHELTRNGLSFRANEPVAFPSLLHSGAAEELLFLAGKMILVLAEDGGGEGRGRQT